MGKYLFVSVWIVALAGLTGCTPDRPFDPGTDYPEWGWDKREYTEPAAEPQPYIKGENGAPDIYRNQQRLVYIKRPRILDPQYVPRPAVYVTSDQGQSWLKKGHFGLEQHYFPLIVPEDGTYEICIVPQDIPSVTPGALTIQIVYEIDSTAPVVELAVEPDEGPYRLGQPVVLKWTITDAHPGALPGELQSRHIIGARITEWSRRQSGLAVSGTMVVTLNQPQGGADGPQYRIKATDEFGNIGLGHTPLLRIDPYLQSTAPAPVAPQPRYVAPPAPPGPTEMPADETPSENLPPWSWQTKPAEPAAPAAAVEPRKEEPPTLISRAPRVSTPPPPQPIAEPITRSSSKTASEAEAELAELEALLGGVSGPVYAGRVMRAPKPPATVQPVPMEMQVPPPVPVVAIKPTTAPPPPQKMPIITLRQTPPEEPGPPVVQGSPETTVEIIEPPIVIEAPAEVEPVVTVRPIAETPAAPEIVWTPPPPVEPEPVAVVPEYPEPVEPMFEYPEEPAVTVRPVLPEPQPVERPLVIRPVLPERVADETPVVVIEPAPAPDAPVVMVEPEPVVTVQPPRLPPTPARPVQPRVPASIANGRERIAKPWERLGNSSAAARDFYSHSPTLGNF